MQRSFELYTYGSQLGRRWRVLLTAVALAVLGALLLSLLQTRQYTAKVRLLIEPPGTSDPRAAMAVSPIYLESLHTYEHFASSDHLFAEAAKEYQLQTGAWRLRPLEDLKRRVLRVSIPRNTKVLEIEVTLADASKAHALASYLAKTTIELSRQAGMSTDREMTEQAQKEVDAANQRVREIEAALEKAMKGSPAAQALPVREKELENRRSELERLALSAELSRERSDEARLRDESARIAAQVARMQSQTVTRRAEIDTLGQAYKAALESREGAERRLREIRAMVGYRSERLSMLDPGFVPEQPSSPNLPLNLVVAGVLGLLLSLSYLTVDFSRQAYRAGNAPRLPRVIGKA